MEYKKKGREGEKFSCREICYIKDFFFWNGLCAGMEKGFAEKNYACYVKKVGRKICETLMKILMV